MSKNVENYSIDYRSQCFHNLDWFHWFANSLPPPFNAGDLGSIPGWGTKIPHVRTQLSLRATTTEVEHLD